LDGIIAVDRAEPAPGAASPEDSIVEAHRASSPLSRRTFLRRALTLGAVAGSGALLGCVQREAPAAKPAATSAPAAQPTAVAPAAPAAAPAATSAPAAQPTQAPQTAPAAKANVSEIVIGAIYPLTGPAATVGVYTKNAMQTVADIANGRFEDLPWAWAKTEGLPGLGGAKVRFTMADHQGTPEKGLSEAERLITQEKVNFLIGCYHSAVTATASQAAERAGVVFMNPESSSPTLHTRGFKWYFRTSPHDGHFTQGMFDFMEDFKKRQNVPLKTLGLTYEDTLFGEDSGKTQKELAAKFGYEIVLDIKYRSRSTALTTEVQQLKAANPDVWMPTSYQTDAILFTKTMKELDYNPKMVIAQNAGHTDPAFVEASGKDAEGYITRSPFALDGAEKRPLVRRINELYKERSGGQDLFEAPARVITGFQALLEGVNRAGSVEQEAVRKALLETTIPEDEVIMPWKGIKFGADGQNELVGVIMMQLRGGEYSTVWPFDLASKELLYPIPPWSERP
jgi:branched-chain amino acid transport system substrate-binding protein